MGYGDVRAEQKNDTVGALLHYPKTHQIDPSIPPIYSRVAALFESAGFPELARDAACRLSNEDSSLSSGPAACGLAVSISKSAPAEKKDYLVLWAQLSDTRPNPALSADRRHLDRQTRAPCSEGSQPLFCVRDAALRTGGADRRVSV
jgi:hypothetical protein